MTVSACQEHLSCPCTTGQSLTASCPVLNVSFACKPGSRSRNPRWSWFLVQVHLRPQIEEPELPGSIRGPSNCGHTRVQCINPISSTSFFVGGGSFCFSSKHNTVMDFGADNGREFPYFYVVSVKAG